MTTLSKKNREQLDRGRWTSKHAREDHHQSLKLVVAHAVDHHHDRE